MKKIVLGVSAFLFLCLVVGGLFYWWNQSDVRSLNSTLPEGVKVVKSLIGNEYEVINKIDGYSFKVPPEWQGIDEIAYVPGKTENGLTVAGIELAGREGASRIATINRFIIENSALDLNDWVKNSFEKFGLVGDFAEDNVSNIEVVKTQENVHLGGMYVYFWQKNSSIYAITNGSEEFVRYIITNGKW